jgi:hypothetical protein
MTLFSRVCASAIGGIAVLLLPSGCATNRPDDVPSSAVLVEEGKGRMGYTAPAHGMVYIWDSDQDRLVYSGNIERNQSISLDPEGDRIWLDSRTASEQRLDDGSEFEIYYLRDRDGRRYDDRDYHRDRYYDREYERNGR